MGLCRFFQQGYCRFGDNCRYEHVGNPRQLFAQPSSNSNYYAPLANTHQSRYGGGGQSENNRFADSHSVGGNDVRGGRNYGNQSNSANQTSGSTFAEFVNSVMQELEIGIKGNQWPYSCFGPQKEGENWPGLQDMSPEELRLEAYNCHREGQPLDTYIRGVEMLRNEQMAKNNELKSRSPAVMDLLRKIFHGQSIGTSAAHTAPSFGGLNTGSDAASQFRFTLNQPQSNVNLPQQPPVQINSFGQSGSQPLFFGNTGGVETRSLPFASPTPTIFGGGGQPHQSTINAWPAAAAPTAQTQTFGTEVNQNFFSNASSQSAAPFGQPPQKQYPSTVFGMTGIQQQQSFGSVLAAPKTTANDTVLNGSSVYTPMVELTDDEREQFLAATFTVGRIPIRPPPLEYC